MKRRGLHNKLMDMMGNIRVICRIRPGVQKQKVVWLDGCVCVCVCVCMRKVGVCGCRCCYFWYVSSDDSHVSCLFFFARACISFHCIALHRTAPHRTVLHCTAPHCTAPHCTALQIRCTALHCTALQIRCTNSTCTNVTCTNEPHTTSTVVRQGLRRQRHRHRHLVPQRHPARPEEGTE